MAGGALETHDLVLHAADGNSLAGFAARAPSPTGAGVVVFPDRSGLGTFYEELTMRLADAGFDAVAFDYYGRDNGPRRAPVDYDALAAMRELTVEQVASDAAAAAAYLRSSEGGSVRRLFTLGFCFGGRNAYMNATTTSPVRADGTIAFYGVLGSWRPDAPCPLDQAPRMRGPILGFFGGADQAIPQDQIDAFDRALGAAGAEHEFHVYPGAPHSFFDRRSTEFAGASEDAWRRVVAFLRVHVDRGR
jgi:carboxymethylenebutenolidase